MARWTARKGRRNARSLDKLLTEFGHSDTTVPSEFRLMALPDARPWAEERLDLLQKFEAMVRHIYHRGVMTTDPAEGYVVVLASIHDTLGATLLRGISRHPGQDVCAMAVPRDDLASFIEFRDPVASKALLDAPRGVLVVVVLAFNGVKVWWLPGKEAPSSGWEAALMTFERRTLTEVE